MSSDTFTQNNIDSTSSVPVQSQTNEFDFATIDDNNWFDTVSKTNTVTQEIHNQPPPQSESQPSQQSTQPPATQTEELQSQELQQQSQAQNDNLIVDTSNSVSGEMTVVKKEKKPKKSKEMVKKLDI